MGWRQFRPIEPSEFFVVGYDLSSGMSDSCAVQFLSKTKLDVPLVYHSRVLATEATNVILPVLEKLSDITGIAPIIAPERNAGGTYEIDRLNTLNRNNKFRMYAMRQFGNIENPVEKKLGWETTSASRPRMLSDLKEAIDKQLIRIYDKPTISEMFSFIVSRTNTSEKAQAERGAHDDLIMSLAIAWQLYQTEEGRSEAKLAAVIARNARNRKKWQIH